MAQAPFILADTAEHVGAIIFMIVVFVLWGFGALASAVNRQKKRQAEEVRRREMFERMQREARARDLAAKARQRPPAAPPLPPPPPRPPMLPTAPPLPVQTTSPQAPPLPPSPPRQQRKAKRTRPVPSWQEPLPPQTEIQPASGAAFPDRAEGTAQQAVRSKQPTPAARAAAVSKWLTADTIRSQFILTEILQPPLALREDRDARDV
jgi:hypothetical protein